MSAYPIMLDGAGLHALVVGGGTVALRKTRALLEAGATVRLVAEEVDETLRGMAGPRLTIEKRAYRTEDIGSATLVIAATSTRAVNARVAHDARALGRLVNVADRAADGNCVTPAVHRAGDLVIAVSAGGVPAAAARVRDAIAARYARPYADAVSRLAELRSALLASGRRERWAAASADVVGADFCEAVERGALAERLAAWR